MFTASSDETAESRDQKQSNEFTQSENKTAELLNGKPKQAQRQKMRGAEIYGSLALSQIMTSFHVLIITARSPNIVLLFLYIILFPLLFESMAALRTVS